MKARLTNSFNRLNATSRNPPANPGPDSVGASGGVRAAEPGRPDITPDRPGQDTGSR
jgi:hypothetical protein